ncbi:MAG: hypothetical protein QOG14_643 [Mycobacterium sp.]|jgi:hypothetical protein|nr:hypothetical protein [Mycobacterium sp.]
MDVSGVQRGKDQSYFEGLILLAGVTRCGVDAYADSHWAVVPAHQSNIVTDMKYALLDHTEDCRATPAYIEGLFHAEAERFLWNVGHRDILSRGVPNSTRFAAMR